MGLRNGAYAKIWEHKPGKGNYEDVRLSISKKNKTSGEYEEDFSGWVRFVGAAKEKIASAGESPRFKIVECDVSNKYDPTTKKTFWNAVVFNVEDIESKNNTSTPKPAVSDDASNSENVPF